MERVSHLKTAENIYASASREAKINEFITDLKVSTVPNLKGFL